MTQKITGGDFTTLCQQTELKSDGTTAIVGSSEIITGSNRIELTRAENPHYTQQLKEGSLIPLMHYDFYKRFISYAAQYSARWYNPSTKKYVRYSWSPHAPFGVDGSISRIEIMQAINRNGIGYQDLVNASAADIYTKGFDGLTFLAEMKQTIVMFLNIGKTLRTLYNRGKGSNPFRKEDWEQFPNRWLEYRYGWRLLYNDIMSLIKLIKATDTAGERYKKTSYATYNFQEQKEIPWNWSSSTGVILQTDTYEVRVSGTVIADIKPPKVLFNPIITAWEATKFSFILDWVIQIGQWLAAMHFLVFSRQYYAAGGFHVLVERNLQVKEFTPKTGWDQMTCTLNSNHSVDWKIRLPTKVNLSIATSLKLNVLKVIDLLSILAQLKRK